MLSFEPPVQTVHHANVPVKAVQLGHLKGSNTCEQYNIGSTMSVPVPYVYKVPASVCNTYLSNCATRNAKKSDHNFKITEIATRKKLEFGTGNCINIALLSRHCTRSDL
jgi:hypothetical protein